MKWLLRIALVLLFYAFALVFDRALGFPYGVLGIGLGAVCALLGAVVAVLEAQ